MNYSLSQLLCCPFCSGSLTGSGKSCLGDKAGFGVLSCYCDRYPVVAGIPILKKGKISAEGHTAAQVIGLIETGQHQAALLTMLMPPTPAGDKLISTRLQALPSIRGIGRLKSLLGRPAVRAWKKQARAFLMNLGENVTACDLFDFYFYHSTGAGRELYNYFAFRFGQPRHLVALSLINIVQNPTKPVLDLGCGFGHVTRNLATKVKDQLVIGVDHVFFSLYVAKNWFASSAFYVCAEVDFGLPFPDKAFSTVLSSDALHLFPNKAICARELKRVTHHDGVIILATLRNALSEHHLYPGTLPPEGYQALMTDWPQRFLGNSRLLARYLQKQGPALACSSDVESLASEKWISLVASHRQELFVDYGSLEDWPHAEGRLVLNPLYKQEEQDDVGSVRLRHVFPSSWYEKEDEECRQYEPETVSISSEVLAALTQGKRTREIERLIAQCIVIGIPELFL